MEDNNKSQMMKDAGALSLSEVEQIIQQENPQQGESNPEPTPIPTPVAQDDKKKEEVVEKKTEEKKPIEEPKNEINFEEIFGSGIKTIEDIKNNVSPKLKEYEDNKKVIEQLNKDKEYLSNELNVVTNPFANNDLAMLNELSKSLKRNDYDILTKVLFADFDNMSPIEIMKLKEIFDNPDRKGKEDLLEDKIKTKYNLDIETSDEMTEDEKKKIERKLKINQLNLEDDAIKVKKEFLKMRTDIKLPQALDEKSKKQKAEEMLSERTKNWTPVVSELANGFKEYPVVLEDNDGNKKELMKYSISNEDRDEIKAVAIELLVKNNIPYTEESLAVATNAMVSHFRAKRERKIYQAIYDKGKTDATEKVNTQIHNPSALDKDKSSTPEPEDDFNTKTEEAFKKRYGL